MRLLRSLVPLLLASGCATLGYREPATGPRARVRFSTNSTTTTTVFGYERPGCEGQEEAWMRLRAGTSLGGEPRRLGMPLWAFDESAAKEVWVRTDRPLSGLFEAPTTSPPGPRGQVLECPVAFVVALEEGGDYEVAYRVLPDSFCLALVTRLVGTEGAWQREPVRVFFARDTAGLPACAERHPGLAGSP